MDREKYIDESWKESVELEKKTFSGSGNPIIEEGFQKQPSQAKPEKKREELQQEAPQPEEIEESSEDASQPNQIHFLNYITSLGFQSMIFLGEIPHPATNEIEKNLDQAKFIIDTLVMLRDKTKGNRTKQEDDVLNSSVYELQMKYVEIMQKEQAGPQS